MKTFTYDTKLKTFDPSQILSNLMINGFFNNIWHAQNMSAFKYMKNQILNNLILKTSPTPPYLSKYLT